MSRPSILASSWAKRWFGIWKGTVVTQEDLPEVGDFVDPAWAPSDKNKLIEYISDSPIIMCTSWSERCKLCEASIPVETYHSDGHWLWPDSLVHYLCNHDVMLPSHLVDHIRKTEYSPPTEVQRPKHELPWPESWIPAMKQSQNQPPWIPRTGRGGTIPRPGGS